jgi:hypothetical protein
MITRSLQQVHAWRSKQTEEHHPIFLPSSNTNTGLEKDEISHKFSAEPQGLKQQNFRILTTLHACCT